MSDLSGLEKFSDWVIVFDLDDTLYQENEYNRSGVIAVANEVEILYGKNITEKLLEVRERKGDIWRHACELLDLPLSVKESFLWMYRLHEPVIELDPKVATIVKEVSIAAHKVAILTNGRSITQRMKLNALGLLEYPLYISEEYSSNKPEKKCFQQIMYDFVVPNYAYVADNPSKDFIAPNSLGWRSIGIRGSDKNIHDQNVSELKDVCLPDLWVGHFEDVIGSLC